MRDASLERAAQGAAPPVDATLVLRDGLVLAVEMYRDHAVISDAFGRRVRIPGRVYTRYMNSQAGKDWSKSVCERVTVAAFRRPRLMGAVLVGGGGPPAARCGTCKGWGRYFAGDEIGYIDCPCTAVPPESAKP